jgi:uncharacterized phage protein gp47/JayE
VDGGTVGNVPPDAIITLLKPDSNIAHITNVSATSGGAPIEKDDDLRERVLEAMREGESFTGCDADYTRWAKMVTGVGNAVPQAEWNGPGTVRLYIVDANGMPANTQILNAIYDYIMSPNDRMKRLAPIGATLTVSAPSPIYVDIEADVVLIDGESIDDVRERFKENIDRYWLAASTEIDAYDVNSGIGQNYIKYVYVGSTLAKTTGVANYDHNTLLINNGKNDILIEIGTYPVTRTVVINERA